MAQTPIERCDVCLGSLKGGDGRPLFTAECGHAFHFNCIASNARRGNRQCVTCGSSWKNLPIITAASSNPSRRKGYSSNNPSCNYNANNLLFADDEPLPTPSRTSTRVPLRSQFHHGANMTVKALPEYTALSKSDESDSFAVLVGIQAPTLTQETFDSLREKFPVDLVAVLDVSGSMEGDKIMLLKQAVGFIINNLGPADRLSVISFSNSAQRVTPFRRMTDGGREDTIRAVNSLTANGKADITAGLKMAVEALEIRREKNTVSSIILLSNGVDSQYGHRFVNNTHILPPCIRSNDTYCNKGYQINPDSSVQKRQKKANAVPVHTFGIGLDHNVSTLYEIADGSHGTFSYIESIEIVQDAFARCLRKLLGVVAHNLEIQMATASTDVRIQSISSRTHRNSIGSSKQHGVIYVNSLYSEEKKQFLVFLSVPPADHDKLTTQLLEVKCSYYNDPLLKQSHESETIRVEIRRPAAEDLSDTDKQICLEVDREKDNISVEGNAQDESAMALKRAKTQLQTQYYQQQHFLHHQIWNQQQL